MATTTQYEKFLVTMDELKTLSMSLAATTDGSNCDNANGRLTPD